MNKIQKTPRGFARMSTDEVRALARKGGMNAHKVGRAHVFSHDEAVAAGRKGGLATHGKRDGELRYADVGERAEPEAETDG